MVFFIILIIGFSLFAFYLRHKKGPWLEKPSPYVHTINVRKMNEEEIKKYSSTK